MATPFDFICEDHGSISLLRPVTPDAKDWVQDHIPDNAQWHGKAVVVEHRYIRDILVGIANDGLQVGATH